MKPFFDHEGCVDDEKDEAAGLGIEVRVQHAVPVVVERVQAVADAFAGQRALEVGSVGDLRGGSISPANVFGHHSKKLDCCINI